MSKMRARMRAGRQIDAIGPIAVEAGIGLRQTEQAAGQRGAARHRRHRRDRKLAESRRHVPQRTHGRGETPFQPREIVDRAAMPVQQARREPVIERKIGAATRRAAAGGP
jgi:hypothetical protein